MATQRRQKKNDTLKNTEDLENELSVVKSQLVRTLADYDNLRKRTEEEKGLWIRFSTTQVLTTLLPILDNFESAQKHLNDSGLAIAIGEFRKVFAEEGLEEINPKADEVFDHNVHEAVDSIETEDDNKNGKIAETVLPGWKFKSASGSDEPLARREDNLNEGKLIIRHAKVKVYKHT